LASAAAFSVIEPFDWSPVSSVWLAFKYGPHERNVLDFWQAQSHEPTPVLVSIRGGGFLAGDKSMQPQLLKEWLDFGISVAAII
jgi:hypothetical protein